MNKLPMVSLWAAQPEPQASATPEERSEAYRPDEGGGETQSGALLLVEAYAAIWLLVLVMVVRSMRKQKTLDQRIEQLREDIARARRDAKNDSGDDSSTTEGDEEA